MCHFPIGILGQVWYLIVSIPDLCIFITFVHIAFAHTPLLKAHSDESYGHKECIVVLVFIYMLTLCMRAAEALMMFTKMPCAVSD